MKRIVSLLPFYISILFFPLNLEGDQDNSSDDTIAGVLQNEILWVSGNTNIDLTQAHNSHSTIAYFRVASNLLEGFEIQLVFTNEGWFTHTTNENVNRIRLRGIRLRQHSGTLGSGLSLGPRNTLSGSEWGYSYSTNGEATGQTLVTYKVQARIPKGWNVHRLAGTYREYLTVRLLAGDSDD